MKLKTSEARINMPVKVIASVTKAQQTGINGINILTGQTVNVFLTTKGKSAQNERRPTIESFFNSGKLKPGGIVMMQGAFKNGRHYLAQWPFVVRRDEADTALLCRHGTLIVNEKDDGTASADFYSFHPEQSINADSVSDLTQAVEEHAKQTVRPAYLIRVVNDQRVIDYELYVSVYDGHTNKPLTEQQIASGVKEFAHQLLDNYPDHRLDVLPASRFFIPAQNYQKRAKYFNRLNRHFVQTNQDGENEYCCRQVLLRCGGDKDQFCNSINVIEPYKQGTDPVLIGGYSHHREQQTDQSNAAGCRP
jgi:hypothetical protein